MFSHVILIAIYVAMIIWVAMGSLDPVSAVVVLLITQLAATITYSATLFRHQKLLEWFSYHVRLDPSKLPEDAPDDLVREEDDQEDD